MGTRALVIFLTTLVGLAFLFTSLDREVADVEVRERISRTPTGKVFQAFPPGQLFRSDFADLQRIDVRMLRQGSEDGPDLFLELREVQSNDLDSFLSQPVVRSARMETTGAERGPLWATFRFEALPASKGKVYHFSLQPSEGFSMTNWAPFVSPRATTGELIPWGHRVQTGASITWDFRSRFQDLACIAIGVDGLDAAAAHCTLELFELSDANPKAEPIPRAHAELHHQAPIASGFAFFSMDPIPDSRWKKYRGVLSLPNNARVLMTDSGPTSIAYHGIGGLAPELLGQTVSKSRLPNRDLVFRAYGEDGVVSNWNKVVARGAKNRFLLALLAWGAAMGLALVGIWKRF